MKLAPDPGQSRSRLAALFLRPSRRWLVAAYAAVAAALLFVLALAVNVPFWDDWEVVRMLRMAQAGELHASDVWSQHNEHRIVLPRLIMFGLAWLTGYDTVAQCVFTVLHLGILLGYVHAAARRSFAWPARTAPLWLALVAWLLLGWRQAENLLWGFQIGLSLPVTAAFVALYHLQAAVSAGRRAPLHLSAAILAGGAASFSSAMGLLVWPCGIALVAAHWCVARWSRIAGAVWAGAGLLAWVAYLVGYRTPADHPAISSSLAAPMRLAGFFAALVGGWASGTGSAWIGALVLGAFGVALYILRRHRAVAPHALWLAMALFCLGTLAIMAVGRSALSLQLAGRSAYATYSQAGVSCLVVLIAAAGARQGRAGQRLAGVALLAIAAGALNGYRLGLATGLVNRTAKQCLAANLLDFRNRSDQDLTTLYGDPLKVRDGASFLAVRHWSVFAHQPPAPLQLAPTHYHFGDQLRFGLRGNARPYLGLGWSIDEDGFTWTDGDKAEVHMLVGEPLGDLRLEIGYAMTFRVDRILERQRVTAYVGDALIGTFEASAPGVSVLNVAAGSVHAGNITLALRLPDAERATTLGTGDDRRRLALAVSSLRLGPRK